MIRVLAILVLGNAILVEGSGFSGSPFGEVDSSRVYIRGSRVVANVEEAPYTVYIERGHPSGKASKNRKCTGSIITKFWVLSAGHCLMSKKEIIKIYAGMVSRKVEFEDPHTQIRYGIEKKVHPNFHPGPESPLEDWRYDIGMTRVNESFVFSPQVNSIGLWAREWQGVPKNGGVYSTEECDAYGWGHETPHSKVTPFLRVAAFTVQFGKGGCTCVSDLMDRVSLCSGVLSNKSMCPGDSGGPLVCQGLLAGVTSGGYSCPNTSKTVMCGDDDLVSRWTYVCPMLDWIRTIIPDAPEKPSSCRSSLFRLSLVLSWALIVSLIRYVAFYFNIRGF